MTVAARPRYRVLSEQLALTTLAVAVSLPICVLLTSMGLSKYRASLFFNRVPPDFEDFSNTRAVINILYVILWLIYLRWLANRLRMPGELSFSRLARNSSLFIVLAVCTYPYTFDVYTYLQYGLMGLNGINPYTTSPHTFSSPLIPFLYWPHTSTYGPVSLVLFMGAAVVVADNLVVAVYLFKVLCALSHFLNGYLIHRSTEGREFRAAITIGYLVNPYLLFEHVANGHVDVFLCTTTLIALRSFIVGQYARSAFYIWMGIFIKTLPLLWAPMLGMFLVRRRLWKEIAIVVLLSSAILLFLAHTFLPSQDAWISLSNPGVSGHSARSVPHLFNWLGAHVLENEQLARLVGGWWIKAAYAGFLACYIATLFRILFASNFSKTDLVASIGWTTLALFLFATPWVMPWYPSILIPIALLCLSHPLLLITTGAYSFGLSVVVGTGYGAGPLSIITIVTSITPPLIATAFRKRIQASIASKFLGSQRDGRHR